MNTSAVKSDAKSKRLTEKHEYDRIKDIKDRIAKGKETTFEERKSVFIYEKRRKRKNNPTTHVFDQTTRKYVKKS